VTEALTRKLNGATPAAALITRATNYGLEKVKRDIMRICRHWEPLRRDYYSSVVEGKTRYSLPSDCETVLSITLLDYTHSGALSAVTDGDTMVLDATEDATQDEVEGHLMVITSGTGANQGAIVYDYNSTTKTVELQETLAVEPDADDEYLIADDYKLLRPQPAIRLDWNPSRFDKGKPSNYIVGPYTGTADTQYWELLETPDKTYGVKITYFADLRRLDTASGLYSTILRRWADALEQGVYAWALGEDDDRYEREFQIYIKMLQDLRARDGYMMDVGDLVRKVIV
jgi:hypothetical protein